MALLAPTGDFVTSTLSAALTSTGTTATIGTGLDLPATNGILQIDYDSAIAKGSDNGPETVTYATYTTGTGALTGLTRGVANTDNGTPGEGVAHANGASVQCGASSAWFGNAMITPASLYNPYKFSTYRNAAWTTPNAAAAKVTPDTEDYDTNSNFATGTYTVPITGYYHFSGSATTAANVLICVSYIYVNGAVKVQGSRVDVSSIQSSVVSKTLYLTAGDTVELYVYTSAAVAGGVGANLTFLSGHLVSV